MKPTKNDETSENQVTLDQVMDIDWAHEQDKKYYHDAYCEFEMHEEEYPKQHGYRVSNCPHCGRSVQSTLSQVTVIGKSDAR